MMFYARNCSADELARQGTTLQMPGSLESVGMPLATCKLILHHKALGATNNRWASVRNCIHSRNMWPRLNLKRTEDMLMLTRHEVSQIVSFMTGHCVIGTHAVRLNVATTDLCGRCGDEEEELSVKHILCVCSRLSEIRLDTLGSSYFAELADLADITIGQLKAFLRKSQWLKERD